MVYPYQGQQQESGALFDYHVNSALDFKIEAEIDLPIPELKITAFKLGHRLTPDSYTLSMGGEWMNHDLDLEAKLKCDTVSTLVDVKSKFNDYQMVTNTIIDQTQFTIGKKKHALKKYDQFALNTSCFWGRTGSKIILVDVV